MPTPPDDHLPTLPEPVAGPVALRTLAMIDPLGIGDPRPPFGWRLSATGPALTTGFQVQVAATEERLAAGTPDLWDSGEVAGDDQQCRYGGAPLPVRAAACWRVRVRDESGAWTDWSETARFELGLLAPDDWSASWVSHPDWYGEGDPRVGEPHPLPLLAGEFTLSETPVRARLHVAGAGVYYASINGEPTSDAVLEPAYTDFRRRVCSATHDVTALLAEGANVLGIELGPGIAHVFPHQDRYMKFYGSQLSPRAIAQLEVDYADGRTERFGTDDSWRATAGPTRRSHWFGGEDYDARREVADWDRPGTDRTDWSPVVIIPGDAPVPSARICPPLRVVERIPAVARQTATDGTPIFDVGVVQAGFAEVSVDLPPGQHLRIVPGDQLDEYGRVLQSKPTTGSPVFNTLITGDGPTTWHSRFRYDGFRYVELQGLPADAEVTVTALVVRADNEPVGEFTTSVDLINDIHTIIERAVQGNMYSVLTDCPHREKLGWLEETHLLFDVIAYNYDVAAYYRELLVTIAEAQTEDGLVPDIAPEYVVFADGFRDDPNWGSAIIQVPWQHYRWYGDAAVLEDHYPAMVRYLDYLTGRSEDGLLTYGLGDWITTDRTTPVPLVGTWGYWRAASAMIDIAVALGRTGDADRFRALATEISTAFGTAFLDPATGRYGNGGQASEILALDVGAVPPEEVDTVLDRLCDSVDDGLNVGEIALPAVFRVLGEAGRHDALWRFATATEHPSYGYQVRHGATSLTEAWDGPTRGLSQNHFMLGAIDSWFYRHLAGIDQAEGSVGWRALEIAPVIVDGLDSVTARTRGARGDIAVSWQRSAETFRLQVEIPAGSTATVRLPALAGTTAVAPPAARPVESTADGRTGFQVPAGRWEFVLGRP